MLLRILHYIFLFPLFYFAILKKETLSCPSYESILHYIIHYVIKFFPPLFLYRLYFALINIINKKRILTTNISFYNDTKNYCIKSLLTSCP